MDTLCEKFGFDAHRRDTFLQLMALSPDDRVLAATLRREVIAPNSNRIIELFYGQLSKLSEFNQVLASAGVTVEQLQKTQHEYLLSLGDHVESASYFETRLRIGVTHAAVGVPLPLYIASYRLLQQLLIDAANPQPARELLVSLILRLTAFDIALAVETYHEAHVEQLEHSLLALRIKRRRLLHDLNTDGLTRAASRRYVLKFLGEQLQDANPALPVVIMADLDHFKAVNDSCGHQVGDKVLRVVGDRIQAALRQVDVVGRYGGEEFLIVLPESDLDTAVRVAERIRSRIGETSFHFPPHDLPVTISQGVAKALPGDNAESLVARADRALYLAKEAGRDCVKVCATQVAVPTEQRSSI